MSERPTAPAVSVVIGSYRRGRFLRRTIAAVRRELEGLAGEIIVVDGGSGLATLAWLTRQKDVVTIVQHNRGTWRGKPIERRSWGYFMNLGFRAAQGRYVCMLSDDSLPVRGSLAAAVADFDAEAAAGRKVGAMAFYWRDAFRFDNYWVGTTLGGRLFVNHGLYAKAALEDVGYADEERYMFYHADGDLCLRMWERGWEVLDCPRAFVEHFPHATPAVRRTNSALQDRDWAAYRERWLATYPDADENPGGAVFLDHRDPSHTALGFPPLEIARFYLNRATGRVRALWRALLRRAA